MIAVLVILSVKRSYHNASLNVEKLTETAHVGDNSRIAQIQAQLAEMDLELHDMKKGKATREEVWCTRCKTEGHDKEQCPTLRNYLNTGAPNPFNPNVLYCEIYRTTGQH